MRAAVKDVAKYFPTAIVSGRRRDKVHFSTKPCFCFPKLDKTMLLFSKNGFV